MRDMRMVRREAAGAALLGLALLLTPARAEEPARAGEPPSALRLPDLLPAAPITPADLGAITLPAAVAAEPTPVKPDPPAAPAAAAAIDPPAINHAIESLAGALRNEGKPGEERRVRTAIADVYAARAFAPLWIADGRFTPTARAAIDRLAQAGADGLDLRAAPPPSLEDAHDDAARARADVALSLAVVLYGREASGGRVDPRAISTQISDRPDVAEPARILAAVASAPDADAALQSFNPPQAGYRALRDKLAEMRREKGSPVRERIPVGPPLRVGMRDLRVPLIRARFVLGEAQDEAQNLLYDTRVAAAVADFQRAVGLPASGVLTRRTIGILSGGEPADLEDDILANMERWRWMPRDMGGDRIEVNIPDYEVTVRVNDAIVHRARVVVGKADTPTPVFSNTMQFLIVNPYWNVPDSIIKKEMLPKLANDPNYLHRLGYEVVYKRGRMIVRQPPGERNALGRIKFMFPNDHAVYLHDTPSRALFASARRAFSHGCVRVDDPFRLAEVVLGQGWSEARVKHLIGGAERTVFLARPLPIHIEYFTAFVDDGGRLQVREDVYGYSRRVKLALGLGG